MKKVKSILYPLTLCGLMASLFAVSFNNSNNEVKADLEPITYIDETGSTVTTTDYEVFDKNTEVLGSSTYYINQNHGDISTSITIEGDVKLVLGKDAYVQFTGETYGNAGIIVEGDYSLKIYSVDGKSGTIKGVGNATGAGIGSSSQKSCGNIGIHGGNVYGTGGASGGAGIGGGSGKAGNNITINGGNVYGTGGEDAAGIGGGISGSCNNVTINGGNVYATGGDNGAGIGGGSLGSLSNLSINGGTIVAEGNVGAGIGGGNDGGCNGVYISHCKEITAKDKSNCCDGIGSGNTGNIANIFVAEDLEIRTGAGNYLYTSPHSMTIDISADFIAEPIVNIQFPGYKVTYDLDGGTGTNPSTEQKYKQDVTVDVAQAPADIAKPGYTFEGWVDAEGTDYAPGSTFKMPDEAVTLKAKWKVVDYTITYNLDGGTNSVNNPDKYTVESENITLEEPSKDGFVFVGWYSEATFQNKVDTISKGSTGDISLFAKFETISKPGTDNKGNGGMGAGGIIGIVIGALVLIYVGGFFCYKYKVANFFTKPVFSAIYGWFDKFVFQKIVGLFKKSE